MIDTFSIYVYFANITVSMLAKCWQNGKIKELRLRGTLSVRLFVFVGFQNSHERFLRDFDFTDSLHTLLTSFLLFK